MINCIHKIAIALVALVTRLSFVFLLSLPIFAQQVSDTAFTFPIAQPTYPPGSGPLILIDEAHFNFHTLGGGFKPFGKLLSSDGFRVAPLDQPIINSGILEGCSILVIANALNESNQQNWFMPTPSAFAASEIEVIRSWVAQGGSLFLIADHMPFAGAAKNLGAAFGFDWLNGFAFTRPRTWPPSVFKKSDKTLDSGPVTSSNFGMHPIDSVITFTGSAFRIPPDAIPVLVFHPDHYSLQPDTAWRFTPETPRQSLAGYYQGALLEYDKGRIAVFGEAAMFTAQIANGILKAGFNSETAPQNAIFLLNVMHWLSGK